MREFYESVQRQTGKRDERLTMPHIDSSLHYLIKDFFLINRSRGYLASMESAIPLHLTDGQLLDHCKLYNKSYDLWELEFLKAMDEAFLSAYREKQK